MRNVNSIEDRLVSLGVRVQGCWADIHAVGDKVSGKLHAAKFFRHSDFSRDRMSKRNLTPQEVMRKEELPPRTYRNLLEREVITDGNNIVAIMPWVDTFLSTYTHLSELSTHYRPNITESKLASIGMQVTSGLLELMHAKKSNHGDIRPENIAIREQNHYITDFGTSSIEGSANKREQLGYFYSQAPELFLPGGKPSHKGDVWSVAALLIKYKLGTYPFEDTEGDKLNPNSYQEDISEYIKQMPECLHQVLNASLTYSAENRISLIDANAQYQSILTLLTPYALQHTQ